MTSLELIGVTTQKKNQFAKKGINSCEELVRFLPRKYEDYSKLTGIRPAPEVSVFIAEIQDANFVATERAAFVAANIVAQTGEKITVYWFNQHYILNDIRRLKGIPVVFAGTVEFSYERGYRMSGPSVCSPDLKGALRIYPVYSKIRGMSQDYLESHIKTVLGLPACTEETVPEKYRKGLMSTKDALKAIHAPQSMEELERARERLKFDDLLYFALRLALASQNLPSTSKFGVANLDNYNKLLASLPFSLTSDQKAAVEGMLQHIQAGKRLNTLLQGDVGSGKTIVAVLMMTAIISCGCQAVIVAPTRQLASQHFQDITEWLTPLGIKVAFFGDSKMKKSLRTTILKELADGTIQIAVGTHALFSPAVSFHKLGMVVIDEEHKFGVAQRKTLTDHAAEGVHCITMSATPIPRTLAQCLYGEELQVFNILTLPAGRLPIKTVAFTSKDMLRLNNFIRYQYRSGHQTYVVCPAIEQGTSEAMEDVISVAKAQEWLQSFEQEGIKTEVLTGKTAKVESAEILERFRKNETNILLATSVIEVGINVPSATGILICSAERFGLASLHQLRGRVGRGNDQGYCVLYGKDLDTNERVQALCATTDGFKIAEEDLRIRGAGDFLGTQQSGDNKYVSLMLSSHAEFEKIKVIAKETLENHEIYPLLERAVADFRAEEV